MATALTSNQQQAGLKSLFIQTHGAASIPGADKAIIGMDAAKNARRCFTDPDYREDAYADLELMGFIPDGQALLSLPDLAIIERLAASAEKRYAASIKELEKRRADRAAKRLLALGQAINGKAREAKNVTERQS
jgi:hypothetical protein